MTREEAIETLKENSCSMCAYGSQSMMSCDIRGCDNIVDEDMYKKVVDTIRNHIVPPATPQPKQKTGRWIADVDKWGDIVTTVNGYRCSECNAFNTDKDNFCSNCGAKMEVGE